MREAAFVLRVALGLLMAMKANHHLVRELYTYTINVSYVLSKAYAVS